MKVVNKRQDRWTVDIMRPGPFGNPYPIGKWTRAQVLERFETYARRDPELMARIKALPPNAILGCGCKPLDCHGDVIVKLWEEMHR